MATNGTDGTSRIVREIEDTRTDIDETIDALQRKLSPGQLVDQALAYLRSGPGEFTANLGESIKTNPMPVALVGIGVAWLMWGPRSGRAESGSVRIPFRDDASDADSVDPRGGTERLHDAATGAADFAGRTADAVRDSASSARDAAMSAVQSAGQRAGEVVDAGRDTAARAQRGMRRLIDDEPLVLGAVGLAVGAVLGASMPQTEAENAALGQARDRVVDEVRDAARSGADSAQQAVREAVTAHE